jgi:anti-sigma-K factor RskA
VSARDDLDADGCGVNAAPYVLGALPDEEHVAFVAHLQSCALCRSEVAELEIVAAALPAVATQLSAPEELKQRVMATVERDASMHKQPAPARVRRPMRAAWPNWRPALAGASAAAVVVALLVAVLSGGGSSSTRVIHAEVLAPRATATVSLRDGRAELDVSGMPQPTSGRVYEVWLERSGAPQPTDALFTVSGHGGDASVGVPGSVSGVTRILVTSEPLGGSSVPTRSPVIVARVS